jgi:hypothetical protein
MENLRFSSNYKKLLVGWVWVVGCGCGMGHGVRFLSLPRIGPNCKVELDNVKIQAENGCSCAWNIRTFFVAACESETSHKLIDSTLSSIRKPSWIRMSITWLLCQ